MNHILLKKGRSIDVRKSSPAQDVFQPILGPKQYSASIDRLIIDALSLRLTFSTSCALFFL